MAHHRRTSTNRGMRVILQTGQTSPVLIAEMVETLQVPAGSTLYSSAVLEEMLERGSKREVLQVVEATGNSDILTWALQKNTNDYIVAVSKSTHLNTTHHETVEKLFADKPRKGVLRALLRIGRAVGETPQIDIDPEMFNDVLRDLWRSWDGRSQIKWLIKEQDKHVEMLRENLVTRICKGHYTEWAPLDQELVRTSNDAQLMRLMQAWLNNQAPILENGGQLLHKMINSDALTKEAYVQCVKKLYQGSRQTGGRLGWRRDWILPIAGLILAPGRIVGERYRGYPDINMQEGEAYLRPADWLTEAGKALEQLRDTEAQTWGNAFQILGRGKTLTAELVASMNSRGVGVAESIIVEHGGFSEKELLAAGIDLSRYSQGMLTNRYLEGEGDTLTEMNEELAVAGISGMISVIREQDDEALYRLVRWVSEHGDLTTALQELSIPALLTYIGTYGSNGDSPNARAAQEQSGARLLAEWFAGELTNDASEWKAGVGVLQTGSEDLTVGNFFAVLDIG